MAQKRQGCCARYRLPTMSRTPPIRRTGNEEAESSDAEDSEGDEAEEENSVGSNSLTSRKPSAARRPKNKRYWRVEDHNIYQRRLVLKNVRREQQEKNGQRRKKTTGALIATPTDTDESEE
eukprot:scaffold10222_cov60-Cylindrotheca_fusiformis.AAC.1